MKKILEVLTEKKNQELLKEIADWIKKNDNSIDIKTFFAANFIVQLGVFIKFFVSKNYYTLVTPNSYAIDYVNPELTIEIANEVKKNLKQNGNSFIISRFDLNVNDILLIYEMAFIDIITIINKPIF